MFNKILVAVDLSEAAKCALDLAIRLAQCDQDHIVLASVLDISKLIAVAGYESPYPIDAIAMLRESNEQLLADTKAECEKAGIFTDTILAQGDACDEILRIANETRVGLICMGTHGRQGLSRIFLGSVAEGVLRRSTVPVLTARPQPSVKTVPDTAHRASAQAAK